MLHEQFDVLNKTITPMYAVRVCSDTKIKLNLARKQKNVNPAFKMIFDMSLRKPLKKRGRVRYLMFYKERPVWSTLMPSLVCRFLSIVYRLSRLSTLLGIFIGQIRARISGEKIGGENLPFNNLLLRVLDALSDAHCVQVARPP